VTVVAANTTNNNSDKNNNDATSKHINDSKHNGNAST